MNKWVPRTTRAGGAVMALTLVLAGVLIIAEAGAAEGAGHPFEMVARFSSSAEPSTDVDCRGFFVHGEGRARIELPDGNSGGSRVLRGPYVEDECVDLLDNPGSFTVKDGILTISTRQGDFKAEYCAIGRPSTETETIGKLVFDANLTLIGGTGMFEKATGSATADVVVDLVRNKVHLVGGGRLYNSQSAPEQPAMQCPPKADR